jgi:hypothetical protein
MNTYILQEILDCFLWPFKSIVQNKSFKIMKASKIILLTLAVFLSSMIHGQNVVIPTPTKNNTAGNVLVQAMDGTIQFRKINVGDYAYGGIVFYVDESGQHGLVTSIESINGGLPWGNNTLAHAHAIGLGSGLMNSMLCIAKNSASAINTFAAGLCQNYAFTFNGIIYGGWYLPSITELELLFAQQTAVNAGVMSVPAGHFNSMDVQNVRKLNPALQYWSSTEVSATVALYYWYNNSPKILSNNKSTNYWVRPIRAF